MAQVLMRKLEDVKSPTVWFSGNPRDFCLRLTAKEWEIMTDEQFDGFLDSLDDKGVTYSMFPNDAAFYAYKKRSSKHLDLVTKKLSKESEDDKSENPREFCLRSMAADWESMTDEHFDDFLDSLDDNGVTYDMFSNDAAFYAYKKRSSKHLDLVTKDLSKEFQDVDLIAALRQLRRRAAYEDFTLVGEEDLPRLPPCVKEMPIPELRKKRSKIVL